MKKILCLVASALLLLENTFAASYTVCGARCYKPSNKSFSTEWTIAYDFLYEDNYIGTIKYGFDKTFVNEDFTKCYSDFYTHYSVVINDLGLYKSSDKLKGVWSKVDKKHSGKTSQVYCAYVKSFYADVTQWDFELHVSDL